jgi:hypothetical protein
MRDSPLKWSNYIHNLTKSSKSSLPLPLLHFDFPNRKSRLGKKPQSKSSLLPSQPPKQTASSISSIYDLLSVKAAATSFASQESKLEVLWNNTGTGPNSFKEG